MARKGFLNAPVCDPCHKKGGHQKPFPAEKELGRGPVDPNSPYPLGVLQEEGQRGNAGKQTRQEGVDDLRTVGKKKKE